MAELIDATAVVSARARLGRDVRIGPYSVIGSEAVLDDGVEIGPHVVLEGRVTLGEGCRVSPGAVIGGEPQDLKYRAGTVSGVRVGPRTVIREHASIHRASTEGADTIVGAECLLMASSHVAHDCQLGDGVILVNYAGLTGHCEIGARATIGGLTGVIPHTRVGTHAYVGGFSKVTRDVPPFVIANGNPAVAYAVNVVGMRRAGLGPGDRRALQEAFRLMFRAGLAQSRALDEIAAALGGSPLLAEFTAFVRASRRGVCHGTARSDVSLEELA